MKSKIRTRFAPSPTGFLTIGNYRTALFNYIFAKQNKGDFILRIEDTDKERSKKDFEDAILEDLKMLELPYDEFYKQSERTEVYKKYLEKLIKEDRAYVSKEESGDRDEVIRFKNPNKEITFTDLIRGEVTFNTEELGDFVIAKSTDEPLYHLTVVVDDIEMEISHVIRGEDHISNTPRQILILEALGGERPIYAHLPLILASDRTKLSKRNGAKSVRQLQEEGFLKEAIINFMALLGWNPGDDQEILSLDEIISKFDLSKVQKGGAIFNEEKLRWLNKQYLLKGDPEEITKYLSEFFKGESEMVSKITPLVIERIETIKDIDNLIESEELDYFFKEVKYAKEDLMWKDETDFNKTAEHLEKVFKILEEIPENRFDRMSIKENLWDFATEQGRGSVLWPLRFCLSGKEKSPDPFVLSEILGKQKTLERVKKAIEVLKSK